mmetsp:Transcript_546/g.1060  ORF Transcript_546/g.1060 Transcript_546/m.1060 type:complete len:180 (+) Transcript_546:38-577(+)
MKSLIFAIGSLMALSTFAVQAVSIKSMKFENDDGASAGQSHTIDALQDSPCEERLNFTEYELERQMDYFSRRLDVQHFNNAMKILKNLTDVAGYKGKVMVHTWELFDKAFTFPRVRRYDFVEENMDMLEHFEDNLNLNMSNQQNLANFIRVAKTVRDNFLKKYHDGEFKDPSEEDPFEE